MLYNKVITRRAVVAAVGPLRKPPVWGIEPVPAEARALRGVDLSVLWFSLGIGLLVLLAGGILTAPPGARGLGLPLSQALLVIVVGSVAGSLLLALAGLPGARTGVPTMVTLRPILGTRGSYVPSALNVLQLLGWTGFELYIMAQAGTRAAGEFLGPWTRPFFLVFFALWCTLLALGGPLVVVRQWLEKFGIWLVIGSTLWITYRAFNDPGVLSALGQPWVAGAPVALAVDLVIVMPISWWPLVSDYNRFARNPRRGAAGTLAGYAVANVWFYALGAALVLISPDNDPIAGIVSLSLGTFALLPVLVDETDNAFANIYSSAISIQNVVPRGRQRRIIVAVAVLGSTLALYLLTLGAGLTEGYFNFLLFIGALFIPLLGILISHHLLTPASTRSSATLVVAVVAWGVGIATYYGFYFYLPDLGSSLPSFVAALGIHQLLSRIRNAAMRSLTPAYEGRESTEMRLK